MLRILERTSFLVALVVLLFSYSCKNHDSKERTRSPGEAHTNLPREGAAISKNPCKDTTLELKMSSDSVINWLIPQKDKAPIIGTQKVTGSLFLAYSKLLNARMVMDLPIDGLKSGDTD